MTEQNKILVIQREIKTLSENLKSFMITDQLAYEKIADWKMEAASYRKTVKFVYDPIVQNSKEAYDKNRAKRDQYLKPIVEAEDIMKRKIKDYENKKAFEAEQERKKIAQEAEAERKRLQDIEDEKTREEAEEFGVPVEEVETVEVEPEYIPPVHNIDRAIGTGIRRNWKCKVVDKSKIPIEYLEPIMSMLNARARADQKNFNIPGCESIYD